MDLLHCAKKTSQGFAILFMVIAISSIALGFVLALSSTGKTALSASNRFYKIYWAYSLADACAEVALQQARNSTPFIGSSNISLGDGSCNYVVINIGGENRQINSTGTVDSISRKVKIIIDAINPKINIASWQEVANF